MEREILNPLRPSSRKSTTEIRLHRRGEGPLPDQVALPGAARLASRLLRLAPATAVDTDAAGPAARGDDPRGAREEPQELREPARARRAAHTGRRVSRKHVARLM